jgi:hypothetical protein
MKNYDLIWLKSVINIKDTLDNKALFLIKNGFTIGKRFTLRSQPYAKVGDIQYSSKSKEYRMILGYPHNHQCREALCVIWK